MELSEALTLLKVEPPIDAVQLRRAYMRAVRAHPPERDPDGFQKVRLAYEFATAVLAAESMATPHAFANGPALPIHVPVAEAKAHTYGESTGQGSELQPETAACTLARLFDDGKQPSEDALLELASRFAQYRPLPLRELESLWRHLADPQSSRALAQLLHEVDGTEQPSAIRLLLMFASEQVTEEELLLAEQSHDGPLQLLAAIELWHRNQVRRSARVLHRLYSTPSAIQTAAPSVKWCLTVILACFSEAHVKAGERLLKALEDWGRGPDAPAAAMQDAAAPLILIHELLALKTILESSTFRGIAQAIARGDLTRADRKVQLDSETISRALLTQFAHVAPNLYAAYREVIIWPPSQPRRNSGRFSFRTALGIFGALIAVANLLGNLSPNTSTTTTSMSPSVVATSATQRDSYLPLRAAAQSVIDTAQTLGLLELQSRALVFRDSIAGRDCLTLTIEFRKLDALAQSLMGTAPEVQQPFEHLSHSLDDLCKAKPAEGTPP